MKRAVARLARFRRANGALGGRLFTTAVLLGLALLVAAGGDRASASSHCSSQSSAALVRDCETLLGVKATLDPTDQVLTNWQGSSAIASWTGVTADATGVTNLNLTVQNQKLAGTIPSELGNLTNLTQLILAENQLTGGIPKELGNLTNLTVLRLEDNKLTGGIPSELGDLTNLTVLRLANNQLTGSIPKKLGDLTNLTVLRLNYNRLTGSIPKELGQLANLVDLLLSYNRLSGSIPKEFGGLTSLDWLELEFTQVSGPIPKELGSLSKLEELYLRHNRLSGSIPKELGNLPILTHLLVSGNRLTGEIPKELANLSTLTVLNLQHNRLTGPIPPELGNLTDLVDMSLDNNRLTGAIPSELGQLPKVRTLWLACNDLSGAVPNAIGLIATLTQLRLWGNPQLLLETDDLPASLKPPGKRADLTVTLSGNCVVDADPAPDPGPAPAAKPKPKPQLLGLSYCAQAVVPPEGGRVLVQYHDASIPPLEIPVGRASADGRTVTLDGIIRDVTLGSTYLVVQRETDGRIVRRWVPPGSPLVNRIPWPQVIAHSTVPLCVVAAIPLDEQAPAPNQLVWRYDWADERIFHYDPQLRQWRHVPDLATFQALGFYWCSLTAVNEGFFERIAAGPPHPAADTPARPDYPSCQPPAAHAPPA